MDTNGDGIVNLGDEIDAEHFDLILSECDVNNDGDVC
jgi:Ca2+-binding EF-hand superfamily protein